MKTQLYVSRKIHFMQFPKIKRKNKALWQLPPHSDPRFNFLKKRQLTNRAIHICNHSIRGNNRLKLDSMDTLVSIVKQPRVDSARPTNRANCPLNKTKRDIKWASFSVNNFGKSFKIGLA